MNHINLSHSGIITLVILFLSFSGCSSDSNSETSSGGGSTSAATTTTTPSVVPAPVSSIAGTYIGTATATASALGLTESETIPVTVSISEDGKITIESGSDIFPDVITLNGNTFSYSQTFADESFGSATCSGTLTVQGAIDSNGKLTATLSSQSVTCNGIPGTVSGTLNATKQ